LNAMKNSRKSFFGASVIARAAKCHERTIRRRAARELWPQKGNDYFSEWTPPKNLLAKCRLISQGAKPKALREFSVSIERRAEIDRALHRLSALFALESALLTGLPFEVALARVAMSFCSNWKSIRSWVDNFSKYGLAGLLEKKRGVVGRKPGCQKRDSR